MRAKLILHDKLSKQFIFVILGTPRGVRHMMFYFCLSSEMMEFGCGKDF